MKSKAIWMLYGAILAVVATVSMLNKAHAAEATSAMLKPTKALSFDVGAKRAVAYFRPVTGICNATVVLAPLLGETGELPEAGARLTVPVLPGKKVVVDTAEGKGLEFGCAIGARSMTVRTVETVAWSNARS